MLRPQDVRRAAVVGAGTIGPGVALALLLGGLEVHLADLRAEALAVAGERIEAAMALLAEAGGLPEEASPADMRRRLTLSTAVEAAVAEADFVEECVPEDPEIKRDVLGQFERLARPGVWLATNTSTLGFAELIPLLRQPERLVGVHWVQPPYIVPTVEVIRGRQTADAAVTFAVGLLKRLGKVPVVVGDIPGFIVNRLQHVLLNEALSIVEQGSSLEDVDAAFRDALAPRLALWGIFGTHDRSVDKRTSLANARHITRLTGDPKFGPSPLFELRVAEGANGVAAGRGWYDYAGRNAADLLAERDRALLRLRRQLQRLAEGDQPPAARP